MRFAGRLTDWNDDKGYGFVVPNGGGERAFVHIKAFARGSRRPVTGDLISYLPSPDGRGRLQATQVRHAGQNIEARPSPSRAPRAALGLTALGVAVAAALMGLIPLALGVIYVVMSGVTYVMYFFDKAAAGRGRQRTPENTLHLMALLGGWPGALMAQQVFRHKTVKQPFQGVFWFTVAVNLAAVAWAVKSGAAAEFLDALRPTRL